MFFRKVYGYRKNSENKPRGLYFSKELFEGLIFGRNYIPKGSLQEGNLRFKIGWAYNWREICFKFLFELPCKNFVFRPKEFKARVKSELRKRQ